jgi:hypothetical protein
MGFVVANWLKALTELDFPYSRKAPCCGGGMWGAAKLPRIGSIRLAGSNNGKRLTLRSDDCAGASQEVR